MLRIEIGVNDHFGDGTVVVLRHGHCLFRAGERAARACQWDGAPAGRR